MASHLFSFFYVRYSTMFHLPPLRFHCVGGCWDRTKDSCDYTALTIRSSNHSATSHPRLDLIHNSCLICRLFLSWIGVFEHCGSRTFLNVARLPFWSTVFNPNTNSSILLQCKYKLQVHIKPTPTKQNPEQNIVCTTVCALHVQNTIISIVCEIRIQ